MNRTPVLVYGAQSTAGRRIVLAVQNSDWAAPIEAVAPTTDEILRQLGTAGAVINATMGSARVVRSCANSLYGLLARTGRQIPVVHLSSMTVYGSGDGRFSEDRALPGDLDDYPAAHRDAERLATEGCGATILRPGCEYGPECLPWCYRLARLLEQRRLGDLGARGDGRCNLIYIDDLAQAAVAALQVPEARGQVFNLAMRAPPTWNEYLVALALALGAVPVRRMTSRRWSLETQLLAPPLKVLEIGASRLGLGAVPLPPPIPRSFARLASQDSDLAVDRAERTLGMHWTPLAEGIARAVAAYRGGRN